MSCIEFRSHVSLDWFKRRRTKGPPRFHACQPQSSKQCTCNPNLTCLTAYVPLIVRLLAPSPNLGSESSVQCVQFLLYSNLDTHSTLGGFDRAASNMSTSEIRSFNPKLTVIRFMLDGALDPDHSHFFSLAAPPQVRPNTERKAIETDSPLCGACRSSLEYFTYVLEECKSKRSKPYDLDLQEVALHHQNLVSLFQLAMSGCHLCFG